VSLHEYGMQDPVEVLARADAGGLDRPERVEHGAWTDRYPGRAQRAGEMNEVVGKPPPLLRHHSAARSCARTPSMSSFAFPPSRRAISS